MSTAPPETQNVLSPNQRTAVIASTRSLVGTPFLHQGRDRTVGIDCRGMILCICDDVRYELVGDWPNNYRRKPDPAVLRLALETEFRALRSLEHAQPADILLLRLPRQPEPTHLGIFYEGQFGTLLAHSLAMDGRGRVIEEPIRRWLGYVAGAFTWRPERFHG